MKEQEQRWKLQNLFPNIPELLLDVPQEIWNAQKLFRKIWEQLSDIPELFQKKQELLQNIQKLLLKVQKLPADACRQLFILRQRYQLLPKLFSDGYCFTPETQQVAGVAVGTLVFNQQRALDP